MRESHYTGRDVVPPVELAKYVSGLLNGCADAKGEATDSVYTAEEVAKSVGVSKWTVYRVAARAPCRRSVIQRFAQWLRTNERQPARKKE